MTPKGAVRLREELEQLKSVKRPEVIAAIAEARAHGDLKENAEYHAAREQQGFIEGRIKQLEGELSHAELIDVAKLNAGSKVVFGATVTLADVDTDEEKRYQIVGDLEADIKQGLIAISSPVARALIGKHEGDTVAIEAPAGTARVRNRRRRVPGLIAMATATLLLPAAARFAGPGVPEALARALGRADRDTAKPASVRNCAAISGCCRTTGRSPR